MTTDVHLRAVQLCDVTPWSSVFHEKPVLSNSYENSDYFYASIFHYHFQKSKYVDFFLGDILCKSQIYCIFSWTKFSFNIIPTSIIMSPKWCIKVTLVLWRWLMWMYKESNKMNFFMFILTFALYMFRTDTPLSIRSSNWRGRAASDSQHDMYKQLYMQWYVNSWWWTVYPFETRKVQILE